MNIDGLKDANMEGVRERFIQIISEHPQKWWSDNLGVSQGLISSSWKVGKLPRLDTLFKILVIKNISPNWFLFNLEPKYINDLDGVAKDPNIDQNREAHLKMLEAENELLELRSRVKYLENTLRMQKLSRLSSLVEPHEQIDEKDIFNNHGLPLITFMRLLNDIMFKSFEITLKNQVDDNDFKMIIDWLNKNFDSGKFTAIAALKNLNDTIPQ